MSQFSIGDIGSFVDSMTLIDQAQKRNSLFANLVVNPGKLCDASIRNDVIADGSIRNASIAAAEIDKSMRPVNLGDMADLAASFRRRDKSILLVTPSTRELLGHTFGSYKVSDFPFNDPISGIKADLCIWDEVSGLSAEALANKRWERSLEWLKGPDSRLSPDEWRKQYECDFDGEPSKEEIDKEHAKYCREMKRRERAAASRSTRSRPWERF